MEEEYRMQKAQTDIQKASTLNVNGSGVAEGNGERSDTYGVIDGVIYEDGTVSYSRRVDDNASTRGMASPATPNGLGTHTIEDTDLVQPMSIPTIRVSTESNRVARGKEEAQEAVLVGHAGNVGVKENEPVKESMAGREEMEIQRLERPVQAAAATATAAGEEKGGLTASDASLGSTVEAFSFSNKRLCERWLDNLFMVLYEVWSFRLHAVCPDEYKYTQDLRVWTIFRAEVAHFKTQHVAYRKTGLEWEILGDLGSRLYHSEEAKEAYQRCLDTARYVYATFASVVSCA